MCVTEIIVVFNYSNCNINELYFICCFFLPWQCAEINYGGQSNCQRQFLEVILFWAQENTEATHTTTVIMIFIVVSCDILPVQLILQYTHLVCICKCLKKLSRSLKKGSSVPSALTPILTLNYSSASMSSVETVWCDWWSETSRDNSP